MFYFLKKIFGTKAYLQNEIPVPRQALDLLIHGSLDHKDMYFTSGLRFHTKVSLPWCKFLLLLCFLDTKNKDRSAGWGIFSFYFIKGLSRLGSPCPSNHLGKPDGPSCSVWIFEPHALWTETHIFRAYYLSIKTKGPLAISLGVVGIPIC